MFDKVMNESFQDKEKMMKLVWFGKDLFAVTKNGEFVGQIINECSGGCIDNPNNNDVPGTFARLFEGHGYIYHQDDNPPNPLFVRSWGDVFVNPELLPTGTKNVFVDQGRTAEDLFNAVSTSTN